MPPINAPQCVIFQMNWIKTKKQTLSRSVVFSVHSISAFRSSFCCWLCVCVIYFFAKCVVAVSTQKAVWWPVNWKWKSSLLLSSLMLSLHHHQDAFSPRKLQWMRLLVRFIGSWARDGDDGSKRGSKWKWNYSSVNEIGCASAVVQVGNMGSSRRLSEEKVDIPKNICSD